MTREPTHTRARHAAILMAGALGSALVLTPAFAQTATGAGAPPPPAASDSGVTVAAPPYPVLKPSPYGPVQTFQVSRTVSFDDLNLKTDRGADSLYGRVRRTARVLCRRLDFMYPITAEGSPPCYDMAVQDALYQANNAIDAARQPPPASKAEYEQEENKTSGG